MRIPRLYHPGSLRVGGSVELCESAANHVARVLRLRPGAAVALFNGEGGEYRGVVTDVGRRQVTVTLDAFGAPEMESPLAITLLQGVSKGERMDYTIQKAVELGVVRIIPVFTARSVVALDGERLDKRHRHWESVAASACEQCGRNHLPHLDPPVQFKDLKDLSLPPMRLVLDPRAANGASSLAPPETALALLIGPEGGLSDDELDGVATHGFYPLRLGPRVLRTETAAVAALAALQTLWGDLR